jgi:hypothetical protein
MSKRMVMFVPMLASVSRIFMNEQMHWTLEATCSGCGGDTIAPLVMGVPILCSRCGVALSIDADRTVFRRSERGHYAGESKAPLRVASEDPWAPHTRPRRA